MSRLTQFTNFLLLYTGLSPSAVGFSKTILLESSSLMGLSLFARHYSGNLVDIFSSGYLDVSVPRVYALRQVFNLPGCPIRTSTDHSLFATPRSFSQLTTSFVVSESQGIPHTPLFASCFTSWLSKTCSNPDYSVCQ